MSIGVIISTPGRVSLARTLASIHYQRWWVEDVLVVGDGESKVARDIVEDYECMGLPARYVATRQTRDWGHSQLNYALKRVRGDYVVVQDDDDIFLPRAFDEMHALVDGRPLIGRVKTPRHGLLWQRPNETTMLDGHCLVAPNDKARLGWFRGDYNGDQGYIHTTLRNYGSWAWCDRVWTLTRPTWKLWPEGACTVEGRWSVDLCRGPLGEDSLAVVSLEPVPETDTMQASVGWITLDATDAEMLEIAEFIAYAAQGKDVRIDIAPHETSFRVALETRGYKPHYETAERVEMTRDWPPMFYEPVPDFTCLLDSGGNKIDDWRDPVWGGHAVP